MARPIDMTKLATKKEVEKLRNELIRFVTKLTKTITKLEAKTTQVKKPRKARIVKLKAVSTTHAA